MTIKAFKCTVDLAVHRVTAPGVRLANKEDLYLNVCLLGQQRRTRLAPPQFPLEFNDHLIFEKTFRFCNDPTDVVVLLNSLHAYIELIQIGRLPGSEVLANYETTAKEFLYPYSTTKLTYHTAQRELFLTRTMEFTGMISPQLEFCTTTKIEETRTPSYELIKEYEERLIDDPIINLKYQITNKRQKKKQRFTSPHRMNITQHTISSAIKADYNKPDVQHKLRELNSSVDSQVKFASKLLENDEFKAPFVIRRATEDLIGRKPRSHDVLNDGLVFVRKSRSPYRSQSRRRDISFNRSLPASRSRSNERNKKRLSRSLSPRWHGNNSKNNCSICSTSYCDCKACQNYRYKTEKTYRKKLPNDETRSSTKNLNDMLGKDKIVEKSMAEIIKENRYKNSADFSRKSYDETLARDSFRKRYGKLDPYYEVRDRIRDSLVDNSHVQPPNRSITHHTPSLWRYWKFYPWYNRYSDYIRDLEDELFALQMRVKYPQYY